MTEQRQRMTFFRSFIEAAKRMDADRAGRFLMAIALRAFDGVEPDFSGDPVLEMAWLLVEPVLEKSEAKARFGNENAKKRKRNANETQTKRKKTRTHSDGIGEGEGYEYSLTPSPLSQPSRPPADVLGWSERLFREFPAKKRGNPLDAQKEIVSALIDALEGKITPEDRKKVIDGISAAIKAYSAATESRYLQDAATWFHRRRYTEDFGAPEPEPVNDEIKYAKPMMQGGKDARP